MSLGLFNCRLIQPAGDQLFFFAGCLASSGKLCSVSLCPILLGPDQREGAACFLFFLLRKVLFGFFKGGEAPVGCRRLPPIQLRIPTKILNPTHRFCYRALIQKGLLNSEDIITAEPPAAPSGIRTSSPFRRSRSPGRCIGPALA